MFLLSIIAVLENMPAFYISFHGKLVKTLWYWYVFSLCLWKMRKLRWINSLWIKPQTKWLRGNGLNWHLSHSQALDLSTLAPSNTSMGQFQNGNEFESESFKHDVIWSRMGERSSHHQHKGRQTFIMLIPQIKKSSLISENKNLLGLLKKKASNNLPYFIYEQSYCECWKIRDSHF